MKTSITLNNGVVEIICDSTDYEGRPTRLTRFFSVHADGGYVREWIQERKEWAQVCDRLTTRGNTLYMPDGDQKELLALIRREWRAKTRYDKARSYA